MLKQRFSKNAMLQRKVKITNELQSLFPLGFVSFVKGVKVQKYNKENRLVKKARYKIHMYLSIYNTIYIYSACVH